jgi:hypothetical protein
MCYAHPLSQSNFLAKAGDILNLLRFHSSFANGEINTASLSMQPDEGTAIYSAGDALLGQDGDAKQAVLAGFLLGEGDWQGVSCTFNSNNFSITRSLFPNLIPK